MAEGRRDEAARAAQDAATQARQAERERKGREEAEARAAAAGLTMVNLRAEVEALRKSAHDLQGRNIKLSKELEVSESSLEKARDMYREVSDAAAPLIDALTPEVRSSSHQVLVDRLKRSAAGLKEYIRDLASHCSTHLLSIVKALYPEQDMRPFAEGAVEGVEDYSALEAEVAATTELVMNRLDF